MGSADREELLMQLHQCVALLQRGRIQAGHQAEGMGQGQGRLLYLLNKMEGASHTDLVNILESRPGSVNELVDRLEHLELVDRRRSGVDRRKMNLFLTPEGKETVTKAEAARNNLISDVFADFTEAEVEQFSFLLAKMLTRLSAVNALDLAQGERREDRRSGSRAEDRKNADESGTPDKPLQ